MKEEVKSRKVTSCSIFELWYFESSGETCETGGEISWSGLVHLPSSLAETAQSDL